MTNLETLLKRCENAVARVVLCATSEERQRLLAAKSDAELMSALVHCAIEAAITLPCPSCPGILERVQEQEPWSEAHFQCNRCQGTYEIDQRMKPKPRSA